eukprot:TRINITY_DN177_c0_g1_i5.p1 TRINITY_DN177_c0_g1~~TRINITY_DN177_c0_g1_i5.p1  ORF type:complete len:487 (+),score=126.32 TRINITY_DN177_c0_g1_i5:46-1461(+)
MLRSLVGSEMCIRDRYQRRVRGPGNSMQILTRHDVDRPSQPSFLDQAQRRVGYRLNQVHKMDPEDSDPTMLMAHEESEDEEPESEDDCEAACARVENKCEPELDRSNPKGERVKDLGGSAMNKLAVGCLISLGLCLTLVISVSTGGWVSHTEQCYNISTTQNLTLWVRDYRTHKVVERHRLTHSIVLTCLDCKTSLYKMECEPREGDTMPKEFAEQDLPLDAQDEGVAMIVLGCLAAVCLGCNCVIAGLVFGMIKTEQLNASIPRPLSKESRQEIKIKLMLFGCVGCTALALLFLTLGCTRYYSSNAGLYKPTFGATFWVVLASWASLLPYAWLWILLFYTAPPNRSCKFLRNNLCWCYQPKQKLPDEVEHDLESVGLLDLPAIRQMWKASCPRITYESFQMMLYREGYLDLEDVLGMVGGMDGEEFVRVFQVVLGLKPPEIRRLKNAIEELGGMSEAVTGHVANSNMGDH